MEGDPTALLNHLEGAVTRPGYSLELSAGF